MASPVIPTSVSIPNNDNDAAAAAAATIDELQGADLVREVLDQQAKVRGAAETNPQEEEEATDTGVDEKERPGKALWGGLVWFRLLL